MFNIFLGIYFLRDIVGQNQRVNLHFLFLLRNIIDINLFKII